MLVDVAAVPGLATTEEMASIARNMTQMLAKRADFRPQQTAAAGLTQDSSGRTGDPLGEAAFPGAAMSTHRCRSNASPDMGGLPAAPAQPPRRVGPAAVRRASSRRQLFAASVYSCF